MNTLTLELLEAALSNGYRFDIGNLEPSTIKAYEREVTAGKMAKVKAPWPWLHYGSCHKTCYINLERPS